jgi:hypothetical protein
MPVTITANPITSGRTVRITWRVPGHPSAGHVTRLPGRLLDRCPAVTMTLTDAIVNTPRPGHRIRPHAGNQAALPGQIVPQAITLATPPPEMTSGRNPVISPPGPEALCR